MDLTKITDAYELRARVLPALLVVLPVVALLYVQFPVFRTLGGAIVAILIGFGLVSLIASISRQRGKQLEAKLIHKWGGLPTIIFLRHADNSIDVITKGRYREKLQTSIPIQLPSVSDENNSPSDADKIYGSAVRWLKSKTRDTSQHRLVLEENINYGFARNLCAMKSIAICLVLLALVGEILFQFQLHGSELSSISGPHLVFITLLMLDILGMLIYVNENLVRRSADNYAIALLSTLDAI